MRRIVLMALMLSTPCVFAAQNAPAPASPATPPGVVRDCPDCPEMIVVPAGTFSFGTPSDQRETDARRGESPPTPVTISRPFAMARTEVTVGEFRAFVQATQYAVGGDCRVLTAGGWQRAPERGWQDPGFRSAPADNEPVVCVSFDDARAYSAWLSKTTGHTYRLPTETEWEYAARGGTASARYFDASSEADVLSLACDYANVYDASAVGELALPIPYARCGDGHPYVAPVGSYKPNAFDLYDMLGNVREWVEDCYTESAIGRPDDGSAWVWAGGCELRGVRGGSFATRPSESRAAYRGAEPEGQRQADLGFRIVREL